MAEFRNRKEDFKDAVRSTSLSLGYNESLNSTNCGRDVRCDIGFIRRDVCMSHIMILGAYTTVFGHIVVGTLLDSIKALEQFIVKHRKDYVDRHRTTEQERDNIENEISAYIKVCNEQIDILRKRIHDEDTSGRIWLGMRADSSKVDLVANRHGMVLILSERLHSVTARFEKLREVRFNEAINRAMPRRRMHRAENSNSLDIAKSNRSDLGELDVLPVEPLRVQQQLLDEETQALQEELTSLLNTTQETETKMVEMSALNNVMSSHLLQQAQQIEMLYDQAVEATNNVDRGNKELDKAIKNNSSSRTFTLLFLFVLTFSVLFLDWYS
ncbi:hypothetical protein GIB67_007625 [Kingdonia uniflora]|uniref:Syntaxin-81 n=1 Tax=Kingdonia uniflora TaxID=39325 RepID=A0A7J7N1Q7_9MAGN|nr:hypothetical protein GIB67_007625 [Kingdonia uniflora]